MHLVKLFRSIRSRRDSFHSPIAWVEIFSILSGSLMCIKIHQYLVPPNPRFCDLFLGLWQWSMWINLRAFDTHPLVWSRRRARQWKVQFFRAPKKQHGSGHVRTVYQACNYAVNQDPRFFSTSLNYCLGNLGKLCQGEDRWCSSQLKFLTIGLQCSLEERKPFGSFAFQIWSRCW